MKHTIIILLFTSLVLSSCSQERQLKNEIHIYHWNNDIVKEVSLTEINNGRKIKIHSKNIEIKKKYDSMNKTPYLLLTFKDAKQFQINKKL